MLKRVRGFYEMFWTVSKSRDVSMGGELPIKLTELQAYFNLTFETDPEFISRSIRYIQSMDAAYLKIQIDRNRGKNESGRGGNTKARN